MSEKSAQRDRAWYGTGEEIHRIRGSAFEWTCFGATLFGISMVFVLLAYLPFDAIRPLSATRE